MPALAQILRTMNDRLDPCEPHKENPHHRTIRTQRLGSHDLEPRLVLHRARFLKPALKFTLWITKHWNWGCCAFLIRPAHRLEQLPSNVSQLANHILSAQYYYPFKTTLDYPFKTTMLRGITPSEPCDYPFEIENFHSRIRHAWG